MHGERNCARLEFQGGLKTKPGATPDPLGMTMEIQNGNTSGVSWFDPELGITNNSKTKKGVANPPQKITNQMSQALNIKLDSVKYGDGDGRKLFLK